MNLIQVERKEEQDPKERGIKLRIRISQLKIHQMLYVSNNYIWMVNFPRIFEKWN